METLKWPNPQTSRLDPAVGLWLLRVRLSFVHLCVLKKGVEPQKKVVS